MNTTKSKHRWVRLLAISLLSLAASSAWAANNKHPITNVPYEGAGSHCDACRTGIGVTTVGAETALSAIFDLSSSGLIQAYVALPQTSPLALELGGIYKSTFKGNQNTGLHWGGHLGLGSESNGISVFNPITGTSSSGNSFVANFGPVLGFHFPISGIDRIGVAVDATANFQTRDGNFNFSIGGLSSILGLSVHYFL